MPLKQGLHKQQGMSNSLTVAVRPVHTFRGHPQFWQLGQGLHADNPPCLHLSRVSLGQCIAEPFLLGTLPFYTILKLCFAQRNYFVFLMMPLLAAAFLRFSSPAHG